MVNILNSGIAIDADAELNGRWIKTPWDGVKFKIAGAQTPKYRASLRANLRKRNCAELNELSEDDQENVVLETLIECCFLDWKGFVTINQATGEKEEIPYSVETAFAILKDRTYIRIKDFVTYKASILTTFDLENADKVAKN